MNEPCDIISLAYARRAMRPALDRSTAGAPCDVFALPVTAQARASYHDLRGSGLTAIAAVELVALLERLSNERSRIIAMCQALRSQGVTAEVARAWLHERGWRDEAKRDRRTGSWGRIESGSSK